MTSKTLAAVGTIIGIAIATPAIAQSDCDPTLAAQITHNKSSYKWVGAWARLVD